MHDGHWSSGVPYRAGRRGIGRHCSLGPWGTFMIPARSLTHGISRRDAQGPGSDPPAGSSRYTPRHPNRLNWSATVQQTPRTPAHRLVTPAPAVSPMGCRSAARTSPRRRAPKHAGQRPSRRTMDLSLTQAAQLLGQTRRQVEYLIKTGRLPTPASGRPSSASPRHCTRWSRRHARHRIPGRAHRADPDPGHRGVDAPGRAR
jgi:hypothetical protein